MDWRTLVVAFSTVFLAELGDKTQLMVLILVSGRRGSAVAVWVGASLALVTATALGVAAGEIISRVIPEAALRYAAGGLFIVFGILIITGKF